ncbi:reverse transcriptase, partial [Globisporangium splendens]
MTQVGLTPFTIVPAQQPDAASGSNSSSTTDSKTPEISLPLARVYWCIVVATHVLVAVFFYGHANVYCHLHSLDSSNPGDDTTLLPLVKARVRQFFTPVVMGSTVIAICHAIAVVNALLSNKKLALTVPQPQKRDTWRSLKLLLTLYDKLYRSGFDLLHVAVVVKVASQMFQDCDIMATRDLNGQKVSFHAHPRFTRIVQLWGGNGRYNTTRSFYRQQVAATRTQIGKDTRDAAVNKAVHTAGSLWPGLQLIQWSELHNIPGITVYTEKADLSCSNPECSQVVQSSVQHLFWECPKAKLVWNYLYALWTKIGITPGHDPAIWIFSLDLPDTPRHAWTTTKRHIIGHKFSNEHLQDHLYSVAHMLWRYMSASLIQTIWCAHLRRMDSDPIKSTAEMATMMTRLEAGMRNLTRLAEAQAGDSDGHTVAAVLKAYVDCFLSQTDTIPLTPSDTRGVYLLFFDGGSRGNPGPGGTGSIIVRVHKDSHTASLIWAASMAYSRKDTTNNFAEYWGLIHGLREAQRSHFEPLYVIGDSALIIYQQRMHRSPRQHRLARLYQTSRRLADCIDIRGWYHHYRAFNKMADSAANLAMDTRTSTQVHIPTQRAAFNNLTQDLDNDIMHWLVRSSEDPRSLDNTRQPHIGPREHDILVKDYLAFRSDLLQSAL